MSGQPAPVIFTVGHSRHPIETFIGLVSRHAIRRVVDCRGRPYSRFNPQYNRERLKRALEDARIGYDWRGQFLSGRPTDPRFRAADGHVLWDRVREWPLLHQALDEVAASARQVPTAILCAEEDPRRCHRRFLLTPPLVARGFDVVHIRGDGRLQPEGDLARLDERNDGQRDLFC